MGAMTSALSSALSSAMQSAMPAGVAAANASVFNPIGLFSHGEPGFWLDPSDYSTMFQDFVGTTPCAIEQPVGLILDKRLAGVRGPELRASFAPSGTGSPPAAATYNPATGAATAPRTDVSNQAFVSLGGLSTTTLYEITVQNTGASVLSIRTNGLSNVLVSSITSGQTVTARLLPAGGGANIAVSNNTDASTATFVIVSLKQLPGNHAIQSTATARPILSALKNLLQSTEQISGAYWGKSQIPTMATDAVVAPDGTMTGDGLIPNTTSAAHYTDKNITSLGVNTNYAASVYVKQGPANPRYVTLLMYGTGNATHSVRYEFSNGQGNLQFSSEYTSGGGSTTSYGAQQVGNGWVRIWIAGITDTAATNRLFRVLLYDAAGNSVFAGDGATINVYVWGMQLELGSTLSKYQRVNTGADYDTAGFPHYLKFDGVDDSLSIGNMNLTGTNKSSFWAGLQKNGDATVGMLFEHTTDINTQNGAIGLAAPGTVATPDIGFRTRGTTGPALTQVSGFPAPCKLVLQALYNNAGSGSGAGAQIKPRINRAAFTGGGATTDGQYVNATFYIGRRGGASLPFNGCMYDLIMLGRTATDQEVVNGESFITYRMKQP